MPNTLAHIALNSITTRTVFKNSDLILIYIGAIIPDIPWIFQRVMSTIIPDMNAYDLRLYCVIQSSLFFSIILSGSIAWILPKSKKVLLIFSLGCFLHLFLDSLETKWANGVQFFAPFSWDLFNAGLFWHEHFVIHGLTFVGLIYMIYKWRETIAGSLSLKNKTSPKFYYLISSILLILYFLGPLIFLKSSESADNHFVKTLRHYETRAGKYFEIDRGNYIDASDGDIFRTPFGDSLKIQNMNLNTSAIMSIRAQFNSPENIHILEYHIHDDRDIYSYVGLLMILIFLLSRLFRSKGIKYLNLKIDANP